MNEFFNFSNKENIWSKQSDKDIFSSVNKFFDLFSKLGFVLKNDFKKDLIDYILNGRFLDSVRGGQKAKIQDLFKGGIFQIQKKTPMSFDQSIESYKQFLSNNPNSKLKNQNYQQSELEYQSFNSTDSAEVDDKNKSNLGIRIVTKIENHININILSEYQQMARYFQNPSEYEIYKTSYPNQILKWMGQNIKWEVIYQEVFKKIEQNLTHQKQNFQSGEQDQLDITQLNTEKIRLVLVDIQKFIDEINEQLSYFKIILNLYGEQLIYFFTVYTMWFFISESQNSEIQRLMKDFEDQKQNKWEHFKSDLTEDEVGSTISRAVSFCTEMEKQMKERLEQITLKSILDHLESDTTKQFYQSQTVIKSLDSDIFFPSQSGGSQQEQSNVWEYLQDQLGVVKRKIGEQLQIQTQKGITDGRIKYDNEGLSLIQSLRKNINSINQIASGKIRAFQIFEIDLNLKKQTRAVLFQFFWKLIQGQKINSDSFEIEIQNKNGSIEKSTIKMQHSYFQSFSELKLEQIVPQSGQLNISSIIDKLHENDKQIHQLDIYISQLLESLNKINPQINQQMINTQISSQISNLTLQALGCQKKCPMCGRKCEQQNNNGHKHQVSSGHYMRGLYGVKFEQYASYKSCDQLGDKYIILLADTNEKKTWADIKLMLSEWTFIKRPAFDLQVSQNQKIWNKWGQYLCQQFKNEKKINMTYKEFNADESSDTEKIHFIVLIDDSGSMRGSKWESARNGVQKFLQVIDKHPLHRLSLSIFNSNSRKVIGQNGPEEINQAKQMPLLKFNSGGTDFDYPLLDAYSYIYNVEQNGNSNNFDNHTILFYTDGDTSYPSRAEIEFKKFEIRIKQKIQIYLVTEEANPSTLVEIRNKFQTIVSKIEVRTNIQPTDIGKIFCEILTAQHITQ